MTTRYRLKLASWTVVREPGAPSPRVLDQPGAVALLAREMISDDDREHFIAFYLNAANRFLFAVEISTGHQTATLVHPREVLGPALREGAVSIVVCHNHPTGDPAPSREDELLTRKLRDGAALLDIRLLDHVVIGSGNQSYVSFSERGLL